MGTLVIMATHGELTKPTMASMPVLVFLADHPELLLVGSSSINMSGYHFSYHNGIRYLDATHYRDHLHDDDEEKPDWYYNELAPEITKNLATYRWMQSDWLTYFDRGPSREDDKDNPDNRWSWYSRPYRMTDKGREMVEKWRVKYNEHAAKQKAAKKAVERYIIVSNTGRWSSGDDRRKYAALCKVVGETEKRVYVEHITPKGENKKSWQDWVPSIQGNKKKYVERDVITADGVTIDEYLAMRKVETNHLSWLEGVKEQEDAEIREIRDRYDQRREQNQFAFEDEMREAIEQVKKDA
jgi:hypothetical protein